jgi:hypothetical protein
VTSLNTISNYAHHTGRGAFEKALKARWKGRDPEPRELLLCLNNKPKPLERLTLGKKIADELTSLLSIYAN